MTTIQAAKWGIECAELAVCVDCINVRKRASCKRFAVMLASCAVLWYDKCGIVYANATICQAMPVYHNHIQRNQQARKGKQIMKMSKKRIISLVLVITMLMSLYPAAAEDVVTPTDLPETIETETPEAPEAEAEELPEDQAEAEQEPSDEESPDDETDVPVVEEEIDVFTEGYGLLRKGAAVYADRSLRNELASAASDSPVYVSDRINVDGGSRDVLVLHFAMNGEAASGYARAADVREADLTGLLADA